MASDFPYLYPHTLAEAKRRGEAELHKDSFRENVKCAWAIDKAGKPGKSWGCTA